MRAGTPIYLPPELAAHHGDGGSSGASVAASTKHDRTSLFTPLAGPHLVVLGVVAAVWCLGLSVLRFYFPHDATEMKVWSREFLHLTLISVVVCCQIFLNPGEYLWKLHRDAKLSLLPFDSVAQSVGSKACDFLHCASLTGSSWDGPCLSASCVRAAHHACWRLRRRTGWRSTTSSNTATSLVRVLFALARSA
jgi:hypothetical protein